MEHSAGGRDIKNNLFGNAESLSTRTHLSATLVSTTQSIMGSPIFRHEQSGIGEVPGLVVAFTSKCSRSG